MVALAAGAVVLVRFPFSDLSQTKLRPALVLANANRGDFILSPVTSKPYGDAAAIEIADGDFVSGALRVTSFARPGKLFTANQTLITSQIGKLKPNVLRDITQAVVRILNAGKVS